MNSLSTMTCSQHKYAYFNNFGNLFIKFHQAISNSMSKYVCAI